MKLREFTPGNVQHTVGYATIHIDQKKGTFCISMEAARLLEIKEFDGITILQDEENQRDWYLAKSNTGKEGFVIKRAGTKNFRFNSTVMAREICETMNVDSQSSRAIIAKEPTVFEGRKLFGILAIKPITKNDPENE